MNWRSAAVWALECAAAVGIVMRTRNDPVLAIATFAFLTSSMALLSEDLPSMQQASPLLRQASPPMFLVIPRTYTDGRIIIEYNANVGPIAVHIENGMRYAFLQQRHRIAEWEVFLRDYMRGGSVTARFADSFYLTLSSDNAFLPNLLVGGGV